MEIPENMLAFGAPKKLLKKAVALGEKISVLVASTSKTRSHGKRPNVGSATDREPVATFGQYEAAHKLASCSSKQLVEEIVRDITELRSILKNSSDRDILVPGTDRRSIIYLLDEAVQAAKEGGARPLTRLLFLTANTEDNVIARIKQTEISTGKTAERARIDLNNKIVCELRVLRILRPLTDRIRENIKQLLEARFHQSFKDFGKNGEFDEWMIVNSPDTAYELIEWRIQPVTEIDTLFKTRKKLYILTLCGGTGEEAELLSKTYDPKKKRLTVEVLENDPRYVQIARLCGCRIFNDRPTDIIGDWGELVAGRVDVFISQFIGRISDDDSHKVVAQIDAAAKVGAYYIQYMDCFTGISGLLLATGKWESIKRDHGFSILKKIR